jgi:hypothetical protein
MYAFNLEYCCSIKLTCVRVYVYVCTALLLASSTPLLGGNPFRLICFMLCY